MGLFDLPAPAFAWVEERLADVLPPYAVILLWAVMAALVTTELYRLISPQRRIVAVKAELRSAQAALAAYDGAFAGVWPLIGRTMRVALRRVGLVLPATLASVLPLLTLLVWLDSRYTLDLPPPGAPVELRTPEPSFQARWLDAQAAEAPHVLVLDQAGQMVADIPVKAPVPMIHKRRWWNALLGNPAGYLPADAPIDRVELALPRREIAALGPDWLRGWEPLFFVAMTLSALGLNVVRRTH